MKVSQFKNNRGVPVRNQFIIYSPNDTVLQSYDSAIVKTTHEDGKRVVYLDEKYWNYSKTTGKYRNQFLGEDKRTTEKKIKSGEYQLVDLNKSE
mgnify:CR=1 FL=1